MIFGVLFVLVFLLAWGLAYKHGAEFIMLPMWARLTIGIGVVAVLGVLGFLSRGF